MHQRSSHHCSNRLRSSHPAQHPPCSRWYGERRNITHSSHTPAIHPSTSTTPASNTSTHPQHQLIKHTRHQHTNTKEFASHASSSGHTTQHAKGALAYRAHWRFTGSKHCRMAAHTLPHLLACVFTQIILLTAGVHIMGRIWRIDLALSRSR